MLSWAAFSAGILLSWALTVAAWNLAITVIADTALSTRIIATFASRSAIRGAGLSNGEKTGDQNEKSKDEDSHFWKAKILINILNSSCKNLLK